MYDASIYSIQMKYKQCHDTTISLYMLHLLAIDLAYKPLTLDKASNVLSTHKLIAFFVITRAVSAGLKANLYWWYLFRIVAGKS